MELVKENVKKTKKKPKIRGKFVPGSINRCSRLAASQHTTGAASRRPAHSHFDPLSQLILDWDPKDPLCSWALGGWAVSPRPACPLSCPQPLEQTGPWNVLCVLAVCMLGWGGGPQPSVPWDTASLTPPPGSGTTTVSRYSRKLVLYEVCLRIYVLVISCFSFLLCSSKDLVKDGEKRKRKQIRIFGYTQTFF